MTARLVKSLQNQTKKSPNHRQHGSVTEKNHKGKMYWRRLLREKLEEMQEREELAELV